MEAAEACTEKFIKLDLDYNQVASQSPSYTLALHVLCLTGNGLLSALPRFR